VKRRPDIQEKMDELFERMDAKMEVIEQKETLRWKHTRSLVPRKCVYSDKPIPMFGYAWKGGYLHNVGFEILWMSEESYTFNKLKGTI